MFSQGLPSVKIGGSSWHQWKTRLTRRYKTRSRNWDTAVLCSCKTFKFGLNYDITVLTSLSFPSCEPHCWMMSRTWSTCPSNFDQWPSTYWIKTQPAEPPLNLGGRRGSADLHATCMWPDILTYAHPKLGKTNLANASRDQCNHDNAPNPHNLLL